MKKTVLSIVLILSSLSYATIWLPPVPYGTEFTFYFNVYQTADPNAFYETAPSAADDIHLIKDGGTAANPTNSVTDLGKSMSLVLTATEMQAKVVFVEANDATSPKAYMDQSWAIPTCNHASALIPTISADSTKLGGQTVTAAAGITIATNVGQTATAAANIEDVYVTNWATDWNDVTKMWSTDVNQIRGTTPFDASNDLIGITSDSKNAIVAAMDQNSVKLNDINNDSNAMLASIADVNTALDDIDASLVDINTALADLDAAIGDVNTAVAGTPTSVAVEGTASTFTITAGPAVDNALLYSIVEVTDATDSHSEWRVIIGYTAGRVVTVNLPFSFTPTVADVVKITPGYVIPAHLTR